MKLLVPISGGKDSQATLLWCIEKYGVENLTAIFCDTKWEHQITYDHIEYLVSKSGVSFRTLKSKKYDGFVDLCKKKKRFPSFTTGFCTEELKIKPMIDYLLKIKDHVTIFQGIRRDESENRKNANEQCRYFKYYFEPYASNNLTIQKYFYRRHKISHKQKEKLRKAVQRLKLGKKDEKFFTYRKKEVFEWCKNYADDIMRPFVYSSAEDVLYYSLNRGYNINPLYFMGASRVGCFPCKNARQDELKMIINNFPKTIDRIRTAEKYVGGTFFAPDKIPLRYRTGLDPKSGKRLATMDDVVKYLADKNAQFDLMYGLGLESKCKSVYSICE